MTPFYRLPIGATFFWQGGTFMKTYAAIAVHTVSGKRWRFSVIDEVRASSMQPV